MTFLLTGAVTYDGFYYLSKDLGVAVDYITSGYESITYSIGNSQSFALYHGGLAVASREGISIYSAGGRELFSASHQYGSPTLRTSSKYALLYDNGGKQYSLYNSFSKVSEETLDHAIRDARIAANGEYIISTSSEEYSSVVRFYSNNGKRYDYNFVESDVASVAISRDGTRIAICLIEGGGAEINSEIRLYNVGSFEYKSASVGFSGMPYGMEFLDNGGICVVSSEGVNVFSSGLELEGEYYSENAIYRYSFSENSIAIAHFDNKTSKTRIIIFDKKGNISYNDIISEKALDIEIHNEYLFLQTPSGFIRINALRGSGEEEVKLVSSDFEMLVCDGGRLLICNSSYARFIEFD